MSRVSWVCFRVYLPALVLALWSVSWGVGLRDGNGLVAVWLAVLALASLVAERERIRQRRRLRQLEREQRA